MAMAGAGLDPNVAGLKKRLYARIGDTPSAPPATTSPSMVSPDFNLTGSNAVPVGGVGTPAGTYPFPPPPAYEMPDARPPIGPPQPPITPRPPIGPPQPPITPRPPIGPPQPPEFPNTAKTSVPVWSEATPTGDWRDAMSTAK